MLSLYPLYVFLFILTANLSSAQKHRGPAVKKYAVNPTGIPEVNFDIGESYAGLIPISSNPDEERKLYFWYFVSPKPSASKEILIWLNGGPGASSLGGLLQENGPFLWQWGTFKPVRNPWTWTNLTNVVWVEYPVGTGFTQGNASATTEAGAAQQFLGFWRNFIDTFSMQGYSVYIAGESYAGMFIPHIADAMFADGDERYFDLQATMLLDPLIIRHDVMRPMQTLPFVKEWNALLGLNDTFVSEVERRDEACGWSRFMAENLKYPPLGKMPPAPDPATDSSADECGIWDAVIEAATLINPCFNIYHIATTCPILWDVLGFPGTNPYVPPGAQVYFDRADVKAAINAPDIPWSVASPKMLYNTSNGLSDEYNALNFTGAEILPRVIDRSRRTLIGHSNLGFILLRAGTLLAIQNMTWGGAQGFRSVPADPFFVPYHDAGDVSGLAGAGVMGKTHTERKLTYFGVNGSGHMVPQFTPSAAYRGLEFLLGRIPSLSSTEPFTS